MVTAVGGNEHTPFSRFVITIMIMKSTTDNKISGPQWKIEAAVLPKLATKLSVMPIPFDPN